MAEIFSMVLNLRHRNAQIEQNLTDHFQAGFKLRVDQVRYLQFFEDLEKIGVGHAGNHPDPAVYFSGMADN